MFKAMILLKRKETHSFAEFETWWLRDHVPLAKQLPGLRKAVMNLVIGDGEGAYDGVSELWFDSQEDFEQAYASEIGKTVAADSMANVSRRERMLVTEKPVLE